MSIWFVIILFIVLGFVFSPYITQLIEYVNFGFGKISGMFQYIIRIFTTSLNTLASYNYIMLLIAIFVALKVIFYILDLIRGEE